MTEPRRYSFHSLRFKLALASVVVEAIMLTVLVWNSVRITENALNETFQNHVKIIVPLMNSSLAGPLVQRDYAILDEQLGRIVHLDSLIYVEVRDEVDQVVATRGKVPEAIQFDTSFRTLDKVYDQAFEITIAGRVIGHARYGLNVSLLKATLTHLRTQGMILALIEIILTFLLLSTLAYLLTRHLRTLAQAARAIQSGDYSVRVAAAGRDEVAVAAHAFNAMAQTVEHDVAERKRVEAEIEYLAYSDVLTGLPNRTALYKNLEQAVEKALNHSHALAILLLDLNNFREINDTLGHQNGDRILVQVADRLRRALWVSDIVARMGGDEFAVLLPRLADKVHIDFVVEKIVAALRPSFLIEGVPLDVQTAIGIALYPEHGHDADTLLQHADVALYNAKAGHLMHLIYSSESDHYNPQQLALMAELRMALQNEHLTLHYQPVIDLKAGKAVGVEALVRWQHPSRGLLSPDIFIPTAEKTGLITPLTSWVLANALRQQHLWHRAGINLRISVNISVRNLQQPDIVDEIRAILLGSNVAPEYLTLEITESAIMVDPGRAKTVLTELHNLGIHFAIDDFGIGHSSLAYLQQLPVDMLKVDKSFVMDFENPANAAIVRATIDLAHNLGLSVTAEGVEDEATLNTLKLLGCNYAQGYYLSHPQAVDKLGVWLRESPWAMPAKGG